MKKTIVTLILLMPFFVLTAQSLTDSLKAYYPFSGNAQDASGYGHHGTVNAASLTTDRWGNPNSAYSFNGSTSQITLTPSSHLQPTTFPVSIAAWVKCNPASFYEIFDPNDPNGNYYGVLMNLQPGTGKLQITFGNGGPCTSTSRRTKTGTSQVDDGLWHLVVGVVNSPSNMDLYIDCQNDGGFYDGSANTIGYPTGNNIGRIGTRLCGTSTLPFQGAIDEVRFYNRALTQSDITMLYNQQAPSSSNFLGPNINLCQAQNTTLTANVPGYSNYVWSNGSTTPSITVANPGTYWATAYNNTTCTTVSDTIEVNVGAVLIQPLADTFVCKDQTVVLDAGAGYTAYNWSTGASSQTVSTSTAGTFIFSGTLPGGCIVKDTVVVTFNPISSPTASFTHQFVGANMVSFTNILGTNSQTLYSWSFSDGFTFTGATPPNHFFPCNTPITVTLFASNDCGDDTISNTITYACDAIEEYTRQIRLNVFPQPISEGEIQAAFSLSKAQNYYIVLSNVMGQEVIRTHSERAAGEIHAAVNIESLPAGIYSFAIFTEEGIAVRKITIE